MHTVEGSHETNLRARSPIGWKRHTGIWVDLQAHARQSILLLLRATITKLDLVQPKLTQRCGDASPSSRARDSR